MNEARPIRTGGRRGRLLIPKFKEKIITDQTNWIIDHPDFNGMMNEFRFHEKTSKTTRPNNKNLNEFFNYLVDEPATIEEEDFDTTCKIKDDDKIVTVADNNIQYFNNALAKYQPRETKKIEWGKPLQ